MDDAGGARPVGAVPGSRFLATVGRCSLTAQLFQILPSRCYVWSATWPPGLGLDGDLNHEVMGMQVIVGPSFIYFDQVKEDEVDRQGGVLVLEHGEWTDRQHQHQHQQEHPPATCPNDEAKEQRRTMFGCDGSEMPSDMHAQSVTQHRSRNGRAIPTRGNFLEGFWKDGRSTSRKDRHCNVGGCVSSASIAVSERQVRCRSTPEAGFVDGERRVRGHDDR